MLVSALTDVLGESKISALDLAGNTLEFNKIVKTTIQEKFKEIGLLLTNLFIENMSVPKEVEEAIDQRSKLGILGDKTDVMMKIAAAESMKEAAKNEGMGGAFIGAGVGVGAGVGMGNIFAEAFKTTSTPSQQTTSQSTDATDKICPSCKAKVTAKAKFCPECGNAMPIKKFCTNCGKEVGAGAKFCPECGEKL